MLKEMDSFAPKLLSDESIYSWVSRWTILSGYPSHRTAIRILLGNDNMQITSAFPSFIPKIHKYASRTLTTLIDEHTILPFFRGFTKEDIFLNARRSLLTGSSESLHTRLSLIANRISNSEPLGYCPVCARIDYEFYGHTYWHLQHQLPAVVICSKHKVHLLRLDVGRREVVLPSLSNINTSCLRESTRKEFKLCELVINAFNYDGNFLNGDSLRECYIYQLKQLGLATGSNSIRMDKFRKGLKLYWDYIEGHSLSNIMRSILSNNAYPASIFYQQNCQHHPLKHLLIIGYLFENWDVFIKAYNQDSRSTSFSVSGSKKVSVSIVDDNEIEIIAHLKNGESMRNVAKRVNRSVGYVKKLAHLNDVKTESRAQKLFQTERVAVINLAKQGHSSSRIASALECCVGAVEQIMSQTAGLIEERKRIRFIHNRDKHRAIILKLVNIHTRRTDIQSAARADYTWLYKHDKEWLYSKLPPAIAREKRYKK